MMIGVIASFFGISPLRLIIYTVAGLLLAAIIGVAVYYFHYSQDKIEKLSADLAVMTLEKQKIAADNEYHKDEIKRITEDTKKYSKQIEKLNAQITIERRKATDLANLLREHDLRDLASKKPNLIEKRINKATSDVFKELEEITQ